MRLDIGLAIHMWLWLVMSIRMRLGTWDIHEVVAGYMAGTEDCHEAGTGKGLETVQLVGGRLIKMYLFMILKSRPLHFGLAYMKRRKNPCGARLGKYPLCILVEFTLVAHERGNIGYSYFLII